MKVKDLKPGTVVWLGSRDFLRNGQGVRCTVYRIGRFTVVHEPCGPVIVANPAETGATKYVLKIDEPTKHVVTSRSRAHGAHYRPVCYLNSSRSRQQYLIVADGRGLLPDAEHKVMRDARADREFELEAHNARGDALKEAAVAIARKALVEAGFPLELVTLGVSEYWSKRGRWENSITMSVDDAALARIVDSAALKKAIDEWAEWKKLPRPGVDCAR